jgi:hypothetical protein
MSLTPFSTGRWIRDGGRITFREWSASRIYHASALAAVVTGWAGMTDEEKDAAATLYTVRQCVVVINAKQEVRTASWRNSDMTPYMDPEGVTMPTIHIPDGTGGAVPTGKYVLQEMPWEDTGQGGKSVIHATWEAKFDPVLVKNEP